MEFVIFSTTPLRLEDVPRTVEAPWLDKGSHKFKVLEDVVVSFFRDDTGELDGIVVPAGYITDLSSVPRYFWRIIPPHTTEARLGSVVHDWIYSHGWREWSRKEADQLFYKLLLWQGMGMCKAWLMHKAVRLGGRGGWRSGTSYGLPRDF